MWSSRLSLVEYDGQYDPTWRAFDMAAGTVYGPAGEMLQMTRWMGSNPTRYHTQTWTYNNRLQLTATSNNAWPNGVYGREYRYSATANDGRIESMRDTRTGEEIVYQYDSLQRLIQAATVAGPSPWSQGYSYDGFGNLYKRTGTGAAALYASDYTAQLNSWTNRIGTTDANGNSTAGGVTYDIKNRIASYSTGLATFSMTYSPLDNKRVVRTSSQEPEWTVYFYFGNYLLASNRLKFNTQYNWRYWEGNSRIWIPFAGKRLDVVDRLGSNLTERYLPYGEELSTGGLDTFKWAEYYRDPGGLDYADQRHYSAKLGRFLSADPYMSPTAMANPSGWNRYAYVIGDPVNLYDPQGLDYETPNFNPNDPRNVTAGHTSVTVAGDSSQLVPSNIVGYSDYQKVWWEDEQNRRESGFCTTADGRSCDEADRERKAEQDWERQVVATLETVQQCLGDAIRKHPVLSVTGAALSVLGQPIPKTWVPPYRSIGSRNTTLLSVMGHYINVNVTRVTYGGLGTTNLFRAAGRFAGPVGWGLLALDAALITNDTFNCYQENLKDRP